MDKEQITNDLYMILDEYGETVHAFAQELREGKENLCDEATACYARELFSGLKSVLIDAGMLEGEDGFAYEDGGGSMRGSMRGGMRGSRDEGGSMRQGRTRTGRFKRAYDGESGDLKAQMQEIINRVPDSQTRMDMQRMMDQMQSRL